MKLLSKISLVTAITAAVGAFTIAPLGMAAAQPVLKAKTTPAQKQLWNLQDADIHAVIQTISQITGKNFIVDPRVQGKVTVISTKPMSNDEIYQVFLSMLDVLGYSAVPAGDVTKIVPSVSAKEYGASLANNKHPGQGDEVVVRIVPVNNVSASELVPVLRPLMQEWGSVTAYSPSNTLIFAGAASNIKRLVSIVHEMDDQNASDITVALVKYGNAAKIADVIQQLQSKDKGEGKVENVSIVADPDDNTILVSGNTVERAKMLQLIKELDTKQSNGSSNTVVVHLNYLTAKDIAPILTKIAEGQLADSKSQNGKAAAAVSNLSDSTISIQAETSDNALIISAPHAMIQNLKQVVNELDVPPKQVLVEAVIVRLNQEIANQLGISWGTQIPSTDGVNDAAVSQAMSGNLAAAGLIQGMGFIPGGNIRVLISALEKNSAADVLSTPTILMLNNQQASISDGENVGMTNSTYALNNSSDNSYTPFNTISRQNVALTLKVTPQISPNNMVKLKIDQEDDSLANPTNPGDNPVENTSSVKTTVLVKSGDILVLGGLVKHDSEGGYSKVPFFGDLPILGNLFRYKDKTLQKNNLMIFIKPVIISSAEDGEKITKARYQYMRHQENAYNAGHRLLSMQGDQILLPKRYNDKRLALPSPFS